MLAKLQTFSLLGIDALPVVVEFGALPKTVLVELSDQTTHHIERAFGNSRFVRPLDRVGVLTSVKLPQADWMRVRMPLFLSREPCCR
jgi:magnesium chelatase family protein